MLVEPEEMRVVLIVGGVGAAVMGGRVVVEVPIMRILEPAALVWSATGVPETVIEAPGVRVWEPNTRA
jgi:hypothetical protein